IDAELQTLHADLNEYHRALVGDGGGPGTFHNLVGLWLAESGADVILDERTLQNSPSADLRVHGTRLKEILERGEQSKYATNPWKKAAGIHLYEFLANSMEVYRSSLASCVKAAEEVDALRNP